MSLNRIPKIKDSCKIIKNNAEMLKNSFNFVKENISDEIDNEIYANDIDKEIEVTNNLQNNNIIEENYINTTLTPIEQLKKINQKVFEIIKVKKINNWTDEEDNLLLELMKNFRNKNWKKIADLFPDKTAVQCSSRYRRIQPGINKGFWTKLEDEKLLLSYKKYGNNWKMIAKEIVSRSGKQIRDRFINSLDPNLNKKNFSEKEDKKMMTLYKRIGPKWVKISKLFKGRSGDMIKNRFYSIVKSNRSGIKNSIKLRKIIFKNKGARNKKILLNKKHLERDNIIFEEIQNDCFDNRKISEKFQGEQKIIKNEASVNNNNSRDDKTSLIASSKNIKVSIFENKQIINNNFLINNFDSNKENYLLFEKIDVGFKLKKYFENYKISKLLKKENCTKTNNFNNKEIKIKFIKNIENEEYNDFINIDNIAENKKDNCINFKFISKNFLKTPFMSEGKLDCESFKYLVNENCHFFNNFSKLNYNNNQLNKDFQLFEKIKENDFKEWVTKSDIKSKKCETKLNNFLMRRKYYLGLEEINDLIFINFLKEIQSKIKQEIPLYLRTYENFLDFNRNLITKNIIDFNKIRENLESIFKNIELSPNL